MDLEKKRCLYFPLIINTWIHIYRWWWRWCPVEKKDFFCSLLEKKNPYQIEVRFWRDLFKLCYHRTNKGWSYNFFSYRLKTPPTFWVSSHAVFFPLRFRIVYFVWREINVLFRSFNWTDFDSSLILYGAPILCCV